MLIILVRQCDYIRVKLMIINNLIQFMTKCTIRRMTYKCSKTQVLKLSCTYTLNYVCLIMFWSFYIHLTYLISLLNLTMLWIQALCLWHSCRGQFNQMCKCSVVNMFTSYVCRIPSFCGDSWSNGTNEI